MSVDLLHSANLVNALNTFVVLYYIYCIVLFLTL